MLDRRLRTLRPRSAVAVIAASLVLSTGAAAAQPVWSETGDEPDPPAVGGEAVLTQPQEDPIGETGFGVVPPFRTTMDPDEYADLKAAAERGDGGPRGSNVAVWFGSTADVVIAAPAVGVGGQGVLTQPQEDPVGETGFGVVPPFRTTMDPDEYADLKAEAEAARAETTRRPGT